MKELHKKLLQSGGVYPGTTHGCTHTRLFSIWHNMKSRCYYTKGKDYKDYGARGITVCAEWLHDFAAFRDWAMTHGYRDDLSIDRIDNDKGYSLENCRLGNSDRANPEPPPAQKEEKRIADYRAKRKPGRAAVSAR